MVKILALLSILVLGACSSTGTFCDIAEPHRHSDAVVDAMNQNEVNQELAHNETGMKLCGWRP